MDNKTDTRGESKKLTENEMQQVKGGAAYMKIDSIDGECSGGLRRPYMKIASIDGE